MSESAGMPLRHDLQYLRLLVAEAIRLHVGRTKEELSMMEDLLEYLMWLTVDALEDEELARELTSGFGAIELQLFARADDLRARRLDPTAPAVFEMYLRTLKTVLAYRHRVSPSFREFYSRQKFLDSWERTRKTLGL